MAIKKKYLAVELSRREINPQEWDLLSSRLFYEWAKDDGSLEVGNISSKVKPRAFVPEPYVSDR